MGNDHHEEELIHPDKDKDKVLGWRGNRGLRFQLTNRGKRRRLQLQRSPLHGISEEIKE